jgi:shikimate dehydrogenase
MREFGLIGYPLSHSFSQKYFTEKFKREGIADAMFHAFSIPLIEELNEVISTHKALKGFAITIPYKKAIFPFLSYVDEPAKKMGACNCVKIVDGELKGFNTDVIGFKKSFEKNLQAHHTKALILGTGGAAAAVEFALQQLNIAYTFVSRSADIIKGYISYDDVDANILSEYTIIINCSPVGTYPNVDEAPKLPYDLLTSKHYCFDLVYNPPLTKFLMLSQQQGAIIENGYEMLVLQAEENWRIWNDDSL